jgi:hypothetical protein
MDWNLRLCITSIKTKTGKKTQNGFDLFCLYSHEFLIVTSVKLYFNRNPKRSPSLLFENNILHYLIGI